MIQHILKFDKFCTFTKNTYTGIFMIIHSIQGLETRKRGRNES